MPKLEAIAPNPEQKNVDTTLPDPTQTALLFLWISIGAALGLAAIMNWFGWTAKPFSPAANTTANFALFAGFYVAAQVVERLMLLVAPIVPFWNPSAEGDTAAVKAAKIKADRGPTVLGIATFLSVGASCGFGLFFLSAIGIHVPNTIDTFITGVVIAAGTKPLHDFISLLQNKNTPTTGTSGNP